MLDEAETIRGTSGIAEHRVGLGKIVTGALLQLEGLMAGIHDLHQHPFRNRIAQF